MGGAGAPSVRRGSVMEEGIGYSRAVQGIERSLDLARRCGPAQQKPSDAAGQWQAAKARPFARTRHARKLIRRGYARTITCAANHWPQPGSGAHLAVESLANKDHWSQGQRLQSHCEW